MYDIKTVQVNAGTGPKISRNMCNWIAYRLEQKNDVNLITACVFPYDPHDGSFWEKEGGKILYGGKAIRLNGRCKNGWFIEPTIVEGLNNVSKTNQEEIFGPVVTLIPFEDEEDAIQKANESNYGLSATIWTEDKEKANRVSNHIAAGVVWVNCWLVRDLRTPFGGMKQSGLGREGGSEALRFFTEQKNVCTGIA